MEHQHTAPTWCPWSTCRNQGKHLLSFRKCCFLPTARAAKRDVGNTTASAPSSKFSSPCCTRCNAHNSEPLLTAKPSYWFPMSLQLEQPRAMGAAPPLSSNSPHCDPRTPCSALNAEATKAMVGGRRRAQPTAPIGSLRSKHGSTTGVLGQNSPAQPYGRGRHQITLEAAEHMAQRWHPGHRALQTAISTALRGQHPWDNT